MRTSGRPHAQSTLPRTALVCSWAGRVGYAEAYQWQQQLLRARAAGETPDALLLLEHPPTYTAGTRTRPEHIPPGQVLARRGASFYQSDRGGSVTYHGPGQLVGYGIIDLRVVQRDVHRYLRVLEEAVIQSLRRWGVEATREPGYTGVWVSSAKIASIGVRVSRGVAMHGFALNLDPDLTAFADIVPCGIVDCRLTSLAQLGREVPPLESAAVTVAACLATLLGYAGLRPVSLGQILTLAGDWSQDRKSGGR